MRSGESWVKKHLRDPSRLSHGGIGYLVLSPFPGDEWDWPPCRNWGSLSYCNYTPKVTTAFVIYVLASFCFSFPLANTAKCNLADHAP
jgi:hypothetical protein